MITAAVCTRNRGSGIVTTVRSILENAHPDFQLIVIDQSTDQATAEAIAPFTEDHRLRYIHSASKGLSKARNLALAAARTEIVAFTDDDCEVPVDWLTKVEEAFETHPRIAIVFSNVVAAPHDSTKGFIPTYSVKENRLFTSILQKTAARGMGAGMSVRRSAVATVGGFDEWLGAGGIFQSGEDVDIAIRSFLKRYYIYEAAGITVIHYGYRTFEEGKSLLRGYYAASGVVNSKPVRCGHWIYAIVLAHELFVKTLWPPFANLLRLRRPRGITLIPFVFDGFYKGLRAPIDKSTIRFGAAGDAGFFGVTNASRTDGVAEENDS